MRLWCRHLMATLDQLGKLPRPEDSRNLDQSNAGSDFGSERLFVEQLAPCPGKLDVSESESGFLDYFDPVSGNPDLEHLWALLKTAQVRL